jgi:pimeloyl-ACP methyl ester carboxylesterase
LFATGLLPATALFDSTTPVVPGQPALTNALAEPDDPANPDTPLFRLGFGAPYLIVNDYRVSYAADAAADPDGAVPTPQAGAPLAAKAPTQTLRNAFYVNDLRNGAWAPTVPTLLCGGGQDPTVFFAVNTQTMADFWQAQVTAKLITVLDVDATPSGQFEKIQAGFIASQAALLEFYESAAGGGLSLPQAQAQLVEGYHTAVAPFCSLAARSFFNQISSGPQ